MSSNQFIRMRKDIPISHFEKPKTAETHQFEAHSYVRLPFLLINYYIENTICYNYALHLCWHLEKNYNEM